jgi:hypothetical protein
MRGLFENRNNTNKLVKKEDNYRAHIKDQEKTEKPGS